MSQMAHPSEVDGSKDRSDADWQKVLSPVQYQVLRSKGTERPGTGQYNNFDQKGTYVCAACRSPLYTSDMKFHSGCGWPAFYSCLPKTVRQVPDRDGQRIEILCNACNGHLGHVFLNEGFRNPTNERHCVNSVSIAFVPANTSTEAVGPAS